jgi:hypothetical protein
MNDTWKDLARIVSASDALAENGDEPEKIFSDTTGIDLDAFIKGEVFDEINALIEASKDAPHMDLDRILTAAWIGGFGHGIHTQRGEELKTITPDKFGTMEASMAERMYAGVDEESVIYVAEQRQMRFVRTLDIKSAEELLTVIFAAYIDGFICGFTHSKETE